MTSKLLKSAAADKHKPHIDHARFKFPTVLSFKISFDDQVIYNLTHKNIHILK